MGLPSYTRDSLFNLQDVCIAIGSLATLDLPMVVDMIGIYVLKGPYFGHPGSADDERAAGARRQAGELSNDDVSSNVSNRQEATVQTSSWYLKLAIAKRCLVELGKETSSDANSAATQIQQRRKFSSDANSAATQIQQRRKFSSDANSAATQIQQRRKFSSDANSAATQIQQRRKFSSDANSAATQIQQRRKFSSDANSAATQIQQRRKFSSDANSAATQIQQRRKFSSDANSAATIQQRKFTFSDADFIFSTKLQNSSSLAQVQILVQENSPVKFEKMSHVYKEARTL
ncbi:fimbrin-1-like [Dorcoceras hygrometricum]|uniref:Fimbrin-1-like n=1 Tax=Dorcoceras hygrometricum TaxID=472368 RepID=A0A2Z7ANS4_9LAMI|nr:fimbrin-1-like [Dorcoceras hygrometricum]